MYTRTCMKILQTLLSLTVYLEELGDLVGDQDPGEGNDARHHHLSPHGGRGQVAVAVRVCGHGCMYVFRLPFMGGQGTCSCVCVCVFFSSGSEGGIRVNMGDEETFVCLRTDPTVDMVTTMKYTAVPKSMPGFESYMCVRVREYVCVCTSM